MSSLQRRSRLLSEEARALWTGVGVGMVCVVVLVVAGCVPSSVRPPVDDQRPPDAGVEPVVVDAACTANGCLRELVHVGDYGKDALTRYLMPGVVIDNGYSVYTVHYATDGKSSTAAVTIPFEVAAPSQGFAVVVNAHGTIGVEDPCRLSNTVSGAGLAGLFGARGAIGIAPDYPGLGTDGLHQYLSTREEGTSSLDAVRAALNLASYLTVPVSGRAAVVGLSQGGHAVLSAASLHESYAPELDIKGFGLTAPASVYQEHWQPSLSLAGPHLPNVALLVWDWAEVSGAAQDMWSPSLAPDVGSLMRTRCLWSPSFGTEPTLPEAISEDPAQVFSAEFIGAWSSGEWGAWAFMGERFATNRVVPFAQTAPIRIWQGTADAVVPAGYTQQLVADLNAGGMSVELTLVPDGTHIDTAFGFVAVAERATDESVAWIKARLAD